MERLRLNTKIKLDFVKVKFKARHIVFFLTLLLAINLENYGNESASPVDHSTDNCECCAPSDTNILGSREYECISCYCVMQQGEDMFFSPVSFLTGVDLPRILIGYREKNNSNSSVDSLNYNPIPFRITKTSFPFLQVMLA